LSKFLDLLLSFVLFLISVPFELDLVRMYSASYFAWLLTIILTIKIQELWSS
jgi:hypothetical protein